MTRPPRHTRPAYTPPPEPPALSPAQLGAIADRVLAGDVYRCNSVPECAALLAVLRERGQVIRHRADLATGANPWLFVVQQEATIEPASTIENGRLEERHPATAQADPLRGGN